MKRSHKIIYYTTNQVSVELMIICNGQTVIVVSGTHMTV